MNKNDGFVIKIVVAVTYLVMILLNGLANALPINNTTTGEVSDAFFDLFAPATITFSIWGLIYLLLAGYTLYQFGLFQADKGASRESLFQKVGIYFAISSVANALWIVSWHYYAVGISFLLMVIMVACLYTIANLLSGESFSIKEKAFIQVPFSIYFGWVTVATIANFITFMVSIGWAGIASQFWTVVIMVIGVAIGVTLLRRFQDIAYGLVLIWAYTGILVKHISPAEFAANYPVVIATAIIAIIIFVVAEVFLVYPGMNQRA